MEIDQVFDLEETCFQEIDWSRIVSSIRPLSSNARDISKNDCDIFPIIDY